MRWDLFCRVVDNLGDAAVMWRLARQLAVEHGRRVRLHIDQPAVLQRLLPQASQAAQVDGVQLSELVDDPPVPPGAAPAAPDALDTDVIVSGFHAALPPAWRQRMKPGNPLWINLEYLSAEDWIERFHGLPSPHPDGMVEHYFYPGFVAGSGGLLCERDLFARRDRFTGDPDAGPRFLAELGVQRRPGETLASLLCYPDAPLPELAQQLGGSPATLHLLLPDGVRIGSGSAADAAAALCGAAAGRLRISRIPFLPQRDYDRLLWSCDCNFVRGEDSLVRGLWSGRPFVWQIYPQAEDAHLPKLQAFLGRLPQGLPAGAMRWWNRVPGAAAEGLLELIGNAPTGGAWLPQELLERLATPDLASRLLAFAAGLQYPADKDRKAPGQL